MHGDSKFATAINCMDGRTQDPVNNYMKETYSVDYVDAITDPGPIKIITEKSDEARIGHLKQKLGISVEKHGSKIVAIVGHHDCAGNPVDKEKQLDQIKAAIEEVNSWGFDVETIGLWVGEDWQVEKVF